jgi:predicted AAA+ superfamily ATPase
MASAPGGVTPHFYRTSGGAEIDLVLVWPGGRLWAIEIKRSLNPRPERGFHAACSDLNPERRFVVYPGEESFPLAEGIAALPLGAMARALVEGSG